MSQLPVTVSAKLAVAKRVDEIASGAMELFKEAGSFSAELQVAQAMLDLRVSLTDDMMAPVMGLMNTDLGFRTDRDPKLTPKDRDGNPMTPYPVEVVRECFIESKLRGFHTVGNEWNIISGRFYACKNGLKRKCEQWKGVTDLKVDFGVPKMASEKGAIVPVKSTWKKDGVSDSIAAEIPVRVNFGMASDAIIGKAERKIYKRILDRMSGIITPDGEANDELDPSEHMKRQTASLTGSVEVQTTVTTVAEPKQQEAPAPKPEPAPQPQAQPGSPSQLDRNMTMAGITFAEFKAWAKETAQAVPGLDEAKAFTDLSEPVAARWLKAQAGLVRAINSLKKGSQ